MHSRTLALVALLAACFQPADGKVPIRCDADNPCPDGQVCTAGLCAVEAPPDLAITDMATIASVGCAASNGVKIGDQMWGCPGAFSIGQARSLCAKGWAVCTSLTSVDKTSCYARTAVFVADVPAYYPIPLGPIMCSTTTTPDRQFAACGTNGTAEYPSSSCSGFARFAVHGIAGFDFSNGHSLDKAIGNTASNGVLCCR